MTLTSISLIISSSFSESFQHYAFASQPVKLCIFDRIVVGASDSAGNTALLGRETKEVTRQVEVRRRRLGVKHRCHYRAGSPFATSRARSTATATATATSTTTRTIRVVRRVRPGDRTGAKTVPRRKGRGFHLAILNSLRYTILNSDKGTRAVCTLKKRS